MGKVVLIGVLVTACGRLDFSTVTDGPLATPTDAPVAPSCLELPTTCGPLGDQPCCGSPLVTGGTFYRSFDHGDDGMFMDTSYPATVNDFRLDTYEITVGRFRKFVEAGMGTRLTAPADGTGGHPQIAGSGWGGAAWTSNLEVDTATLITALACSASYATWTPTAGANENLAMNCITWYESYAFCAWDGGFLPTEAEWNYAAAGGTEQRAYPWSSPTSTTIDCGHANYDAATGECVAPPNGAVSPVGSYSPQSDGKWGQADLAGNLWEKVLDTWEDPYAIASCDGCADLALIDARTVRGGAFNAVAASARTAGRYYDPPYERYIEMGARCARLP